MVFYDLDDALLYLLVFENLILEDFGIQPLDARRLDALLADAVVEKFVVHKLFDEVIQFFTWAPDVEYESLILLHIGSFFLTTGTRACSRQITNDRVYFLSRFRIDDIEVRQLLRHHLCVKKHLGVRLIPAIVDIKHVIVVAKHLLELADELTHEHLRPVNEEYWLFGIEAVLILVFETVLDVRVEGELNVVRSLKALVEYFVGDFAA